MFSKLDILDRYKYPHPSSTTLNIFYDISVEYYLTSSNFAW